MPPANWMSDSETWARPQGSRQRPRLPWRKNRARVSIADDKNCRRPDLPASGQITSLTPVVSEFVSPAAAIIDPTRIGGAAGRLASVSQSALRNAFASAAAAPPTAVGGAGDLGSVVGSSIGPAAAPIWNCDLASVVSAAANVEQGAVTAAVNLAQSAIGAERVQQISGFGRSMGEGINRVAALVRGNLSGLTETAQHRHAELGRSVVKPAAAAVAAVRRGFQSVTTRAAETIAAAREGFTRRLAAIKDGAGRAVGAVAGGVRTALTGVAGVAGRLLGRLGSAALAVLPGWARSFVEGIPARVNAAVSRIRSVAQGIAETASRARDIALNLAKSFLTAKLQQWATLKQGAERMITAAGDLARQLGRAVVDAILNGSRVRWFV